MSGTTPRLVATDLDGTLLRADGTVSARTLEVLAAVEERGVPVVFVTGRPLRWIEDLVPHVGSHGLAIVSNGGMIWDVTHERSRLERTVAPAEALAACLDLREAVPGTHFAVEDASGIALEADFMQRHPGSAQETIGEAVERMGARLGSLQELFDRPPLKVLARHQELAVLDFAELAEKAIAGRMTVTWSSSGALLEMSAPGVTKASTLALLCADLGIDAADVLAFGDMPNDIAMLSWAGRGWAVAGAHPHLREVADAIIGDHDEDGVAEALAGVFAL